MKKKLNKNEELHCMIVTCTNTVESTIYRLKDVMSSQMREKTEKFLKSVLEELTRLSKYL